jgi:hypothetical protein
MMEQIVRVHFPEVKESLKEVLKQFYFLRIIDEFAKNPQQRAARLGAGIDRRRNLPAMVEKAILF